MSDVKSARPLSPHLSIYRFRPTMAMSIVHRITGAALYVGTVLLVWWLVAAASGPDAFATASGFFGSIIGQLILFGYSWALIHHMLGGLRHFAWDMGYADSKETSTVLAIATLVGSVTITVLLWLGILIFG
ncbi:succinate dehydrogenase, cytochrome b556 subunit [Aurantimonas sp. 22II-16-19i]|uniref:succinate dehydrogenase, cytochrome b556 subunit n=1 Tax=Aurantimonas sp. 22II-16-19i TaxID=1317114 RepID=UPI0009F7BD13|nr:succinate dehydrogenase, cytochrome b556 subunit [Aurantimonas sp. 22II-16-19i]ORE88137.1 succinate dehydrogenase, cytochrome b556 subunit [Aurantimonas sp. 22II-16-19i]